MKLLALDGVFLHSGPRPVKRVLLTPAGRASVAVMCASAGTFYLQSNHLGEACDAEAGYYLAVALQGQGKHEEALPLFDAALGDDARPTWAAKALLLRARTLARLGLLVRARADLEAVLGLEAKGPEADAARRLREELASERGE